MRHVIPATSTFIRRYQMEEQHIYIAIDLKSFYASVECVERKLDPLTTHLVVADASRTEKTICLAVSPSLKAYGIPGRARLFEVVQRIRQVNRERVRKAPGAEIYRDIPFNRRIESASGTWRRLYRSAAAHGFLYGLQHKNL